MNLLSLRDDSEMDWVEGPSEKKGKSSISLGMDLESLVMETSSQPHQDQ